MDLKKPGNALWLVGTTAPDMGGSHFNLVNGVEGGRVPSVDPVAGPKTLAAVAAAIVQGRVRACHDLSEGGLAVAAAEMAFAGGWGLKLDLKDPNVAALLFSESPSRFLIEGDAGGLPATRIGEVTNSGRLEIAVNGRKVVDASIAELKEAWKKPLQW
jgi:phosphoribosylformylglycinamidine synthase